MPKCNRAARRRQRARKLENLERRELLSVTPTGATIAPTEGAAFAGTVATFTASDAGPFTATIDWGDGTAEAGTIFDDGAGNFSVNGTHAYVDEGDEATSITIVDATDASTATVSGAANVAEGDFGNLISATIAATEFQQFSGAIAEFTDNYTAQVAGDFSASIDWGDGNTTPGTVTGGSGTFTINGSHVYSSAGTFTLVGSFSDDPPSSLTGIPITSSAEVAVSPVVPSAETIAVTEGTSFTGTMASFTASDAGPFTSTIDWGDGATTVGTIAANGSGGFDVSGTHTYADEGTNVVTVAIVDAADSSTVTALGSALVAEGDFGNLNPMTIAAAEGQAFSGAVATFTDDNLLQVAGDWTANIDWGDSTTATGTVTGGSGTFTISGAHTYSDEGTFTIIAAFSDDPPSSLTNIPITSAAVVSEADALTPSGVTIAPLENQAFSGTVATFSDSYSGSVASDFSASIDWGDGTTDAGTVTGGSGAFTVSGDHTYAEDGNYTMSVKLSENSPGTASATANSTANVQENAFGLTAGATISIAEGAALSGFQAATFQDPGSLDSASDFAATINWGDGTTSAGTITGDSGNFTVTGDHTYADELSGSYSVTVSEPSVNFTFGPVSAQVTVAESDTLAPLTITSGTVGENQATGGVAAKFHDAGYPNNDPANFTATFDWGDGTTFSTGAGNVTLASDGAGNFTLSVSSHRYADEGTYVVVATLADNAPGAASASQTGTLTATEADAFTPAATPATLSGTEGITLNGAVAIFNDAGYPNNDPADFKATIDWGDGTTDAGSVSSAGDGSFTVSGSHAYAEDGAYSLTVTLAEDSPGTASGTAAATAKIAESGLTLAMSSSLTSQNLTEGVAIGGAVAVLSDPGSTDPAGDFTAMIDWGDGTSTAGTVTGSAGAYAISGDHYYGEEETYTVRVTAVETSASPPATATVSGPLVVADASLTATGAAVSATEGASNNLIVASFTDSTIAGKLADYQATIDWGDGSSTSGTISANGSGGFNVAASHAYLEEGDETILVVINDIGGSNASAVSTAHVADASLSVTAPSFSSPEYATKSGVIASFTDADPNGQVSDYMAMIDWGDGTTTAGTIAADLSGGFHVTGSHQYVEDGTHTFSVTLVDAGGSTTAAAGTATITEPAISLSVAAIQGHERSTLNGVTVATFEHGDGGEPASNFTATVDWGDGSSSTGTVSEMNGKYTIVGSHLYLDEGSFKVSIQVSDNAASATASAVAQLSEELLPNGTVGTPHERFITEIYRDLLHRQVDATALPYWSAMLDQGKTRLQVVQEIIKASMPRELSADLVNGIYQKYLGRDADADGLAYWTGRLNAGKTIEQVEAGIASTQEFFQQAGGTNDAYLEKLFRLALGREVDASSKASFDVSFADGMSREQAADFVFNSHEYHVDLVKSYYQSSFDPDERAASSPAFVDDLDFLDRPADASGLNSLVSALDRGASDQFVWTAFLVSDEFYNKTA